MSETGHHDEEEDDDLFERLIKEGVEVTYQDWDSGGPGAGAGRVSVYRYEDAYYVSHDAGLDGPFGSEAEASESGGVDRINRASVAVWHEGRGFTWRRGRR
jgi:hypothetical protein